MFIISSLFSMSKEMEKLINTNQESELKDQKKTSMQYDEEV